MPAANPTRFGGSFAPPLDADNVKSYRELAEGGDVSPQVADAMGVLIKMVETHLDRPAPKAAKGKGKAAEPAGMPHPSGLGTIVDLPEEEVERLWDVVPWQEEVTMYGQVFDRIDPAKEKPLRDAAFHLLWFAQELTMDRAPITSDQVKDEIEARAAAAGFKIPAYTK
jgi:hypothetical protein